MFATIRATATQASKLYVVLLVGFCLSRVFAPLLAQAAVINWTGLTNADWNNTGNWNPAQIPTLADDAVFPATIPATGSLITLPSGAQINNLTFNNSYTLQGGSLSFGANQNISIPSGVTVEISSSLLDGSGGTSYLKKQNPGTLILSGDNTGYTSWMDVYAGVVRLTNANAVMAPGGNGYFHVTNANAVLEITGGLDIPGGRTIYLSGVATTDNPSLRSVSGSNIWNGTLVLHIGDGDHVVGVDTGSTLRINGNVNQTGGPDNLVKVGAGTLILAGTGNFTGLTRVKAGTLQLENSAALQLSTLEMNPAYTGSILFGTPPEFTLGGLTGSANLDMQGKTLSIGNNNTDTTYSGVLSNGSLTKIGTGTLTLTADSTYTGPTVVSGGRLTLARPAGDRPESTIQSTSITVNAGAELRLASSCQFGWNSPSNGTTFTLNGGTLGTADNTHNYIPNLVLQNGGTLSMGTGGWAGTWQVFDLRSITSIASSTTNTITSAGGYMANRGAVTIDVADGAADPDLRISATFSNGTAGETSITKTGGGTLELTTANVYTGTTTIGTTTASGGVLRITHGQALGTTDAGTTVLSGQLQLAGGITVTGEALTLNYSGGPYVTLLRNVSGNNTWAGPVTVAAHTQVEVDSGTTLTISGNIISGVRLDKTGAGTLILSGDNSGTTWHMDVYNGVVLLRSDKSPIGSYFHILSPGAVHLENNITTPSGKTLYLSNQTDASNPQVRSRSGHNTWGGNVVLHVSADNDASRSKYIGVDPDSILTILGTVSESTAGVAGYRNLVKVGDGTLELKGAGTYTGQTRILAGTLLANNTTGSATGTGLVRVIGGMLGGTGTVGGSVQVESGGTVSAGNSPGKLTVQGDLTLQTGGTMLVELAGYTQGGTQALPGQWSSNGYDWLSVGGSAQLQQNSILRVALLAGFEPQPGDIFYVLTASGGISDLGIQLVPEALRPAQYWTYGIQPWQGQGGGDVLFLTFHVPEPASGLLFLAGLAGLAVWRFGLRKAFARPRPS